MKKITITTAEAINLFPKILEFIQRYNIKPSATSIDPFERKLAEASKIIKRLL